MHFSSFSGTSFSRPRRKSIQTVECCPQLKRGSIVGQVKQFREALSSFGILLFLPNSLQDFSHNEAAAIKVVAIPNAFLQFCRDLVFPAAEKIDPDCRVYQDVHATRLRRIAAKSPSQ